MKTSLRQTEAWVLRSDGGSIALADLPQTSNTRWVARRKAQVVAAVHGGLLSLEEARARYALSLEEFVDWQLMAGRSGFEKLRAAHHADIAVGAETNTPYAKCTGTSAIAHRGPA